MASGQNILSKADLGLECRDFTHDELFAYLLYHPRLNLTQISWLERMRAAFYGNGGFASARQADVFKKIAAAAGVTVDVERWLRR